MKPTPTLLTSQFIESALEHQPTMSTLEALTNRQGMEAYLEALQSRADIQKRLKEPCYLDQYNS